MKFEDSIKKSIKHFMRGKLPIATTDMQENGVFFSPEYFDELEETFQKGAPKKPKKELENEV